MTRYAFIGMTCGTLYASSKGLKVKKPKIKFLAMCLIFLAGITQGIGILYAAGTKRDVTCKYIKPEKPDSGKYSVQINYENDFHLFLPEKITKISTQNFEYHKQMRVFTTSGKIDIYGYRFHAADSKYLASTFQNIICGNIKPNTQDAKDLSEMHLWIDQIKEDAFGISVIENKHLTVIVIAELTTKYRHAYVLDNRFDQMLGKVRTMGFSYQEMMEIFQTIKAPDVIEMVK